MIKLLPPPPPPHTHTLLGNAYNQPFHSTDSGCITPNEIPLMNIVTHLKKSNSAKRKEGNVLFNDALNTFYLRLYGVRHMVKDHSDSERENRLPPHGLLFSINSKGSFICTSHRQDNTYHGLCYTSRGALAGTRTVQETRLSHIRLATYKTVYNGNQQIHTKCQLQLVLPPQISTRDKCH